VEFCLRYFRHDTGCRSKPSFLQSNQNQQDNSELKRVSKKHFLDAKCAIMLTALWQGVACGLATENNITLYKKGEKCTGFKTKRNRSSFSHNYKYYACEILMRFVY
jgi:hypothetical protein